MNDYRKTADWLLNQLPDKPQISIVIGTGLNALVERVQNPHIITYEDIPGFVQTTAPSHQGNLIFGYLSEKPVLIMQGRFHLYEGYDVQQVVFPIRVMACMRIKYLIITNASGSLRKNFAPADIVLLDDHINFTGVNPLIGPNDDKLGERFPSMNLPYDTVLRNKAKKIADKLQIELKEGVYLALKGPSLETKAECAMFAQWGADLVGMSTVPEVITARHAGMKVIGFSVVTNYSNLFHDLAHEQSEIRENAGRSAQKLQQIINKLVEEIS